MATLQLGVKLFASAREAVGTDQVQVDLPSGASTADLLDRLVADYPALETLRGSLGVAVNLELARPGTLLSAGDEVALLPPVGGG